MTTRGRAVVTSFATATMALASIVLLVVLGVAATGVVHESTSATPERVALEYARAVYANDADALWRLISDADRMVKDEATFRRQQRDLRGFTRDVVRQLAGYITAAPAKTEVSGERASVTLTFKVPNANAPEIRGLMRDWDEDVLEKSAAADRTRIQSHLDGLHRQRALPVIEGDETIQLVREHGGWKIFLNWTGGVRVTFAAAVDDAVPLRASVVPTSAVMSPGDRLRVTVRVTNTGGREVTTRVGHRIEPKASAEHLALLQCPLFVPVTLSTGQTREFTSEYMLLADTPKDVRALDVGYVFPARAVESGGGRGSE